MADNAKTTETLFWHPIVHRRFGEELFFFFFSMRPFSEEQFLKGIKELMIFYKVPEYCCYQVLGEYDYILRVWLPAGRLSQFTEQVYDSIPHISRFQPFVANSVFDKWRFPKSEQQSWDELSGLDESQVNKVQKQKDPELIKKFTEAGILAKMPDYRERNRIKAFVAVSEPTGAVARKNAITKEIMDIVQGDRQIEMPTFYLGLSSQFWMILKFTVPEFFSVGNVVGRILSKFQADGVSTSTFMVATNEVMEGDSISGEALAAMFHDNRIRYILPELYESTVDESLRHQMEAFLKRDVFAKKLAMKDQAAVQSFLLGILRQSVVDSFMALFPVFMEAESGLRSKLLSQMDNYPGGFDGLRSNLDPKSVFIKTAKTMPITLVLKGCKLFLNKTANGASANEYTDMDFEKIGDMRNRIMHGGEFRNANEWEDFARNLLKLIEIRDSFHQQFDKYANTTKETVAPQI